MFCVVWTATLGTALLPDNGIFIAALILWGFFGTLFTLAERIDAGRSISSFVIQLDTALDPRSSLGSAATSSRLGGALPDQLFRTRFQAGLFLGGIAAFWGGFLLLNLMLIGTAPGRPETVGPAQVAPIVLMLGGGIALVVSQRSLSMRLTGRSIPGMWTQMRMLMPSTLTEAARMLGLNGRLVVAGLYSVLVVGAAVFLTSFLSR
jgi:hypothetical protein